MHMYINIIAVDLLYFVLISYNCIIRFIRFLVNIRPKVYYFSVFYFLGVLLRKP